MMLRKAESCERRGKNGDLVVGRNTIQGKEVTQTKGMEREDSESRSIQSSLYSLAREWLK